MNFSHANLCLRPKVCRYREGTVCDMFFETELSDKLNNELESAGISVSEELIARTLAAVQAARTEEESEANINQLIELADSRKRRIKGAGPVLFRVAGIAAACFVLVVGGFALRFSAMRMGKETAPMTPMMTAENAGARNGIQYAADADSVTTEEDYLAYGDVEESVEAAEYPADAKSELIVPATDSAIADEVVAECEQTQADPQDAAIALIAELEYAESAELERTAQGEEVYRFVVRDMAYYLVHENGEVEFAETTADGETVAVMLQNGTDSEEFRRIVLEWMQQNGYEFNNN